MRRAFALLAAGRVACASAQPADFVLVHGRIRLGAIKVAMTVVEGRVVYEKRWEW